MNKDRAEYLQAQIQCLKSAIAHLENSGVEIYNNAPPSVIQNEEKQERRIKENYSPRIYEKSGESFLADLKEELSNYQFELAQLEG